MQGTFPRWSIWDHRERHIFNPNPNPNPNSRPTWDHRQDHLGDISPTTPLMAHIQRKISAYAHPRHAYRKLCLCHGTLFLCSQEAVQAHHEPSWHATPRRCHALLPQYGCSLRTYPCLNCNFMVFKPLLQLHSVDHCDCDCVWRQWRSSVLSLKDSNLLHVHVVSACTCSLLFYLSKTRTDCMYM